MIVVMSVTFFSTGVLSAAVGATLGQSQPSLHFAPRFLPPHQPHRTLTPPKPVSQVSTGRLPTPQLAPPLAELQPNPLRTARDFEAEMSAQAPPGTQPDLRPTGLAL